MSAIDLAELYEKHKEKWVVLDKWAHDYRVLDVSDDVKTLVDKVNAEGLKDSVVIYIPKEQLNWVFKLIK